MLARTFSAALLGVHALPVEIEVNSGENGEMRLIIVGLPDTAVKESQDRVYSALLHSRFNAPEYRTTINLAPGHIRKEGPMYDLPIALAVLASTRQLPADRMEDYVIAGELGLSGVVRPIRGALSMTIMAKEQGKRAILLPYQSAVEASMVEGIDVIPIRELNEAADFLAGKKEILPLEGKSHWKSCSQDYYLDFADVKGQQAVKRAVEVAVAGNHNILIIGPPGSGKSMIAKRIPTIMPEPSLEEFLEIINTHSVVGVDFLEKHSYLARPFRSPHHTISDVGLLGGGSVPRPGEISLAHNGVLFLDELPEFRRSTLEVLRQPLEDKKVTITRSAGSITLPADFTLVAAMNPTPDGHAEHGANVSRSTPAQIQRYRSKLSGPLLDRIDIHIEAPALTIQELNRGSAGESSAAIRERVAAARDLQKERYAGTNLRTNSHLGAKEMKTYCPLEDEQVNLLEMSMARLNLSARAYDRILKVARTIADLAASPKIETTHLLEAIQYRSLDRSQL